VGTSHTSIESPPVAIPKERRKKRPGIKTENLVSEYLNGDSLLKIAGRHHARVGTVAYRLRRAGVQLRKRGGQKGNMRRKDIDTAEIVQLWDGGKGLSKTEIARKVGMKAQGVRYRLKNVAGLELPPLIDHKLSKKLDGEEVERLYLHQPMSMRAIAQQFLVGNLTIHRILTARGVKLRHRTAHMKGWHAEQKQKIAEAERLKALPRPGASPKKETEKEYWLIGEMVEKKLLGKTRSLRDVTAARNAVLCAINASRGDDDQISYRTVAIYHKRYLRARVEQCPPLAAPDK
jgi:hypothetical protein